MMDNAFTLRPLNQRRDSACSATDSEQGDIQYSGNNEAAGSSFHGRLCRFAETTSGKIVLGCGILFCVGIVGAAIAIPATILFRRSISPATDTAQVFFLKPSLTPGPPLSISTVVSSKSANETSEPGTSTPLIPDPHKATPPASTPASRPPADTPTPLILSTPQTETAIATPSSPLTKPINTKSTIAPTDEPCPQLNVPANDIPAIANNLTSQVSKKNLRKRLTQLLKFGSRDNEYGSSSDAYLRAQKYLRRLLRKRMDTTSFTQVFSYGNSKRDFRDTWNMDSAIPVNRSDENCNPVNNNSCNLCALMPGKTDNFIVVGAHLDTVSGTPGANDNGSGVVALLEAIRIFKQSKLKLNNPVLFCFWGSEEMSPDNDEGIGFGSRFFLHNNGYKKVIRNLAKKDTCQRITDTPRLQCYLNLELVGTKNRQFPESVNIGDPLKDEYRSHPTGTQQLTELYAEFLGSRNISFYRAKPAPDRMDTGSFYTRNIPALTITAGPDTNQRCYHKSCDDIDEIDFDVLSNITQTVIYALTNLSLGEGIKTTDT